MSRTFQCQSCGATYPDTQPDGLLYFHACGPLPADKNGVQTERPNRRDENIVTSHSGSIVGIKAEGDGVVCLSDARISEPAWLTKVKSDVAKREGLDDDSANS